MWGSSGKVFWKTRYFSGCHFQTRFDSASSSTARLQGTAPAKPKGRPMKALDFKRMPRVNQALAKDMAITKSAQALALSDWLRNKLDGG